MHRHESTDRWTFTTDFYIFTGMNKKFIFFLIIIVIAGILMSVVPMMCSHMKAGDLAIQNGAKLFEQKNFDQAESFFQQALKEDCSYSKDTIYMYIANCYSQKGDFDSAILYRKKALEIDASDFDNYNNLGMLYRLKKDDASAEIMFKKATELAPKNIVAFASLGALYLTANRIDEAIEYFDKALYIDDSDGAVHADLAICYARKGKFDDAENEYAEAVKQKADNLEKFRAELNTLEGASVSK